jgi:ferritin-like metal-binding protein YciE
MNQFEQRRDVLKQYVTDMLGVDKHIHEAIRRQRDDKNMQQHSDAHQLVARMESTLDQQISELEQHVERLGGNASSTVKDAVSATLGAIAGMYDKVRSETASKMLRDDYTALNLAAISYTMLHTTALALQDQTTADLALRHLRAWTPLITGINRVIPTVVTKELMEDSKVMVDSNVAPEAIRQTQQAWDSTWVNQNVYA